MGTEDPEFDWHLTEVEIEEATEHWRQWRKAHPPRYVDDVETGEYL